LYQPLKHQFTIWQTAAIFDLEAITRPDHKTDIKYEFLHPKNPRKHMMISTAGQTIEKTIYNMAGGGHL